MPPPPPIIVVGSTNTDMVIKTSHFPAPGETIIGGSFLINPGGKGANQAVAAARLGGRVVFVSKVGQDTFGAGARVQFADEGIDHRFVTGADGQASGVALITLDQSGENTIVVAPGANAALSPADVEAALNAHPGPGYVLTQLETPLPTVLHLADLCRPRKKRLILNPAPAQPLPEDLYPKLYAITPNESEAEILTGIALTDDAAAARAADYFLSRGVQLAVITLGAKGAYLAAADGGERLLVPGRKVTAADTTAAGDTFNGALVVALSEGRPLREAAAFANRAAALSVTRMGAQASIPRREEVASVNPDK